MKAPNYQVDLIKDVKASSADASGVASAIAQEGAIKGKLTGQMIEAVGGTVFEAYKGKQLSDFETALEKEKSAFTDPLKKAGQDLLQAEEAKKAGIQTAAQTADTFAAGSILEGADPDTVYAQAGEMFSKAKSSIVTDYENKLKNYESILSSFPARQDEMMARSEALLKQYIAKMPGLADQFREASSRILGVKGIESFTTMQAYRAVENFSNQQQKAKESAAAAFAKEEADIEKAFVDSYVATKLGTPIEAKIAYRNNREGALQLIKSSSEARTRYELATEELKAGKLTAESFVTRATSAFEASGGQAVLMAQEELKKLGITPAQLATGVLPPEKLNDPKVKEVLERFTTFAVNSYEQGYNEIAGSFRREVASGNLKLGVDDSDRVIKSLDEWKKNSLERLIGNKTGVLGLLANVEAAKEKRLDLVFKASDGLTKFLTLVDPAMRSQIFNAQGPEAMQQLIKQYPMAKQILPLLAAYNAAIAEPSPDAVFKFIQQTGQALEPIQGKSPALPIDYKNQTAVGMRGLQLATIATSLQGVAQTEGPLSQDALNLIQRSIQIGASDVNFGTAFFKSPAYQSIKEIQKKATPAEQEQINAFVTESVNTAIYSYTSGHGDALSSVASRIKANPMAAGMTFADTSGANQLTLRVAQKPLPSPEEARAGKLPYTLDRMSVFATTVKDETAKANAVLANVDSALRLKAQVTNGSIIKLRQEFMQRANAAIQKGVPISSALSAEFDTQPKKPAAGASSTGASSGNEILSGLKNLGYN